MKMGKKFRLLALSIIAFCLFCLQISECYAEKYAVLVSTEEVFRDDQAAHSEFWYDLFLLYETLIRQGYTHEHIYVLYAEGQDFISSYPRFRVGDSHPEWLDKISQVTDYNNHRESIENIFSWLKTGNDQEKIPKMTVDDDLFFWWLGHGREQDSGCPAAKFTIVNHDYGPGPPFDPKYEGVHHYLTSPVTDTEIRGYLDGLNYKTLCVFFPGCNSGGIIDEFEDQNTIVMTAAPCGEEAKSKQFAYLYDVWNNEFNYHLYCALNGSDPMGNPISGSAVKFSECDQILWGLGSILGEVFSYLQDNMEFSKPQLSDIGGLAAEYVIFNVDNEEPVQKCNASKFHAGNNIFVPANSCDGYDSYQLMQDFGKEYISMISWMDPRTGKWQSNYWFFGRLSGNPFPIEKGQVYRITMLKEKMVFDNPCLAEDFLYTLPADPDYSDKAQAQEAVDSAYLEEDVRRVLYRHIDDWLPDPVDQQSPEGTSVIETRNVQDIWQQRITAGIFGRLSKVMIHVAEPGSAKFFVNVGAPWQSDNHDFETVISAQETGWLSIDTHSANINLNPGDQFSIGIQGVPSPLQTPWKDNENGMLYKNYNWNYTMGYKFTPLKSGYITRLGGYFNGTKTVSLWDSGGKKLTSVPVTSSYNWSYADIAPVAVTAGQTYTVEAYLAGSGGCQRYWVQPTFPRTHGDVTIQGSCYAYGNTYPVGVASYYSMYGQVDIGFETGASLGVYRSDSSTYEGGELWSGPSSQHPEYDLAFQTFMLPGEQPSVQTPWSDHENGYLYKNYNWNYTMGYKFIPETDGYITKLGGYFNGTKTVSLWDPSGRKLTSAPVTSSYNWSYADIAPVAVTAGQTYTVAAYLAGSGGCQRYWVQPTFPRTHGDVTIRGSCYAYGNTYPVGVSSYYSMYGQVDIGFVSSPLQTPWKDNENGTSYTDLGWNYTMGYSFIPQVDGKITKIGGLFKGIKKITIWDDDQQKILVTTMSSDNNWRFVDILPLSLMAGKTYTIAAHLAGSGGSCRVLTEPLPKSYGDIEILGSRYVYGDGFPVGEYAWIMYGQVDIGFVADRFE